nr:MAG TPA: hypothetical protein [Caudoviricetes sp.]
MWCHSHEWQAFGDDNREGSPSFLLTNKTFRPCQTPLKVVSG